MALYPDLDLRIPVFFIYLVLIILILLIFLHLTRISRNIDDLQRFLLQYRDDKVGKRAEKEDKTEKKVTSYKKILEDSETQTHDSELESSRDKEMENEEIEHSHDFSVGPSFGDSVAGKPGKTGSNNTIRKMVFFGSSLCEELYSAEDGIDEQDLVSCNDQETLKSTFEVANNDAYDECNLENTQGYRYNSDPDIFTKYIPATCQAIQSEDNREESKEEGVDCIKSSTSAECMAIIHESVQENIVSKNNNGEFSSTEWTFPPLTTPQREGDSQGSTEKGPDSYRSPASAWCTGISQESVESVQDNTDYEIEVSSSADSGIYTDLNSKCTCTSTEVLHSNLEDKDRETDAVAVKEQSSSKDAFDENAKLLEENDQGYKPVSKEDTESVSASHAEWVVCIQPRKDECNDSCPASLRSKVVQHDDGSTSVVSPKVDSSTEVYCQIGTENRFIYTDEGYSSLSSLESLASDFGDSMPSLDGGLSSLESVTGNGSSKSKMTYPNDTTSNIEEAEVELPDETESESDSPKTRKTVETGRDQVIVPYDWWRFSLYIHRIFIVSNTQILVFQIGLTNRVNTNCAGRWTQAFECEVKHKGDRIFLCPYCFIFVKIIPSKQFTTKLEQILQDYSFVDTDLAISHKTAAFEMGRSGNGSKLSPTKDEDLTHMPKYHISIDEMTDNDEVKPDFTSSSLYFVDKRPEKQFGVEVNENAICTGEMHFDSTRCNFKRLAGMVFPRPELYGNENTVSEQNFFLWRSMASDYGKNELCMNQGQETKVITQEVLSNETMQKKRRVTVRPKKSKKHSRKQSTTANRSNDQLNVRIKNGGAFKKEFTIGSSLDGEGFNLPNTPMSIHDDQNSIRSISEKLHQDDGSTLPGEKSKPYPAGSTELYHRWLEKRTKSKGKTTGRKQRILQHSDTFREKCNSFTILKDKKLRRVSTKGIYNLPSSWKKQALHKNCHLTNLVKDQVKHRFPKHKYGLCSGKLDTYLCRIPAKLWQVDLKGAAFKQMRLKLVDSRLCRMRKSKGAYDFKSKMKAQASCPCCICRFKELNTQESQIQTEHTETKTAQAITKFTRCKIANRQLRSENVCCFNPQIHIFRKNIRVPSANVSADNKGENSLKETNPHGDNDFGDIDGRKFRGKSSDYRPTCSRLSRENIENILFAKLLKIQSDEYKALFKTIGAEYCFSTEKGFVCFMRDFDCWTSEEAMDTKNILKRFVLERIGPIEIYPGLSVSKEEDTDVEFTR